MNNRWTPYMTEEMLDVLNDLNMEYMKEEFFFCHKQYLKAKEISRTQLGTLTQSGEKVRHGSVLQIDAIAKYWLVRRDLIKEFLPRDWVEEQGVNSWLYIKS